MAEKTSKICEIKDMPACDFLGSGGCKECPLYKQNVRQFERRKINEIWEVTLTNLPESIDDLHEAEECFFCKKEKKEKRVAYAMVEIAHPDPPHEAGEMFGLGQKVRRPVGSMIQVPVAICKDCKRRMDMLDNVKFIGMGIGFLLGLLVIWLISGMEFIQYGGDLLPIFLFLLFIALGYLGGKMYQKVLIKKYEQQMYLRFFDIPAAKELAERGWFIQDEQGRGKLFVKKGKPRADFRFISKKQTQAEEQQPEQP